MRTPYYGKFDVKLSAHIQRTTARAAAHNSKTCPYCLKKMRAPRNVKVSEIGDLYPTNDHVVPRSKGGSITVVVCSGCNNRKGDMMPDDFLELLSGCQRTSARIAMIGALIKEAKIEEAKTVGAFSATAFAEAMKHANKKRCKAPAAVA